MDNVNFNYDEFICRNIGFLKDEDQKSIQKARIFIPGVGGMGGAALETLVRLGVQNFIIADFDVFEVSNMNRQVMSTLDTVGVGKVEATVKRILSINPQIQVQTLGREWVENLDSILPQVDFALNGCDDIKATLQLMRKAKALNKTVIDAFASPLPNVYVVRPEARRPEEVMNFPSHGLALSDLTPELEKQCQLREVQYVVTHSSSAEHVVWKYVEELLQGKRKRFSLAPMVLMTGNLMAYEALKLILGQKSIVDERGVFYNPWKARVEKPLRAPLSWVKAWLVRRHLS